MVDDRSLPQAEIDGDRGVIEANAERLLRLLLTLPGRRDDALAIVNGFFGDRLAGQGSTLAIPMALRSRTDALALDRESLAESIPQATGRICLLVHGLMANESVWEFPGDRDTTYGSLLARDHGVTPVYLRYNSGRHISINGRELAGLLHRLVTAWPVPVHDISLIGHSMGGLVIRSARHYASATRPWQACHQAPEVMELEEPANGAHRRSEYRRSPRTIRQSHQHGPVVLADPYHAVAWSRA